MLLHMTRNYKNHHHTNSYAKLSSQLRIIKKFPKNPYFNSSGLDFCADERIGVSVDDREVARSALDFAFAHRASFVPNQLKLISFRNKKYACLRNFLQKNLISVSPLNLK